MLAPPLLTWRQSNTDQQTEIPSSQNNPGLGSAVNRIEYNVSSALALHLILVHGGSIALRSESMTRTSLRRLAHSPLQGPPAQKPP